MTAGSRASLRHVDEMRMMTGLRDPGVAGGQEARESGGQRRTTKGLGTPRPRVPLEGSKKHARTTSSQTQSWRSKKRTKPTDCAMRETALRPPLTPGVMRVTDDYRLGQLTRISTAYGPVRYTG